MEDQEYFQRYIDLRHALFEDGVEAFKVVEACGTEMVWHAAFDFVG